LKVAGGGHRTRRHPRELGTGSISIVLAGVVLALIPSAVIFAFAQRYFIEGITAGSLR
jgi:multiple sugar transport system permease protein